MDIHGQRRAWRKGWPVTKRDLLELHTKTTPPLAGPSALRRM